MPSFEPATAFVVMTPGLEEALVDELADLGIAARPTEGGASFTADLASLYAIHLHSRLAARVLVRVGNVSAGSLEGLAQRIRLLPWTRYIWPGQEVEVKVSTSRSRLRRRDAVEKKVAHAIADAMRGPRLPGPRPPREPARVQLRIVQDKAEVSMDASGDPLHRRGWRLATARAPIRENLAAAILRVLEWDPGEPLVDPMCGSGTFPIEAATIALGLPPGARRSFAFERWPCHDAALWAQAQEDARLAPLDVETPIYGSDRSEGAIVASKSNGERARIGNRVSWARLDVAQAQPPAPSGLVVMNPPWGLRIGGPAGAVKVLRHAGRALRRWKGWRFAVLLPDRALAAATGLPLQEVVTFESGGTSLVLYATPRSEEQEDWRTDDDEE